MTGMTAAQPLNRVRVVSIEPVARDVRLYRLAPVEPARVMPAEAGAHLDVHLPGGLVRQYSLLLGLDEDHYLIAVKKEAAGRGGSKVMHDEVRVGQQLAVGVPRNHFPLADDSALSVLFAGGIGITPVWSMVLRLEALGRPYELHYACRSREDVIFAAEIARRAHAHLHVDDESGGFMDIAAACARAPDDAHLYCCGPAPMMAAFRAATGARSPQRVHREDFGAGTGPLPHRGFELRLARSNRTLDVLPGQRIVDALRGAGMQVAVSCEQGICGACETRVLDGRPDHGCQVLSPAEREAGDTMMVCCGGSRDALLVLDL